jgi:hypothetical protein
MRIKTWMPTEYSVAAVIAWAICLMTALVTAVPYWAGDRTWLTFSGFVYPLIALVTVLTKWTYYPRRFGSDAEIRRRLDLTKRQQVRYVLFIAAGGIPSLAIMIVVWVQAWPFPHH